MRNFISRVANDSVRRAAGLLQRFSFPSPTRPIVLIQSDDWGRTGIPQLECLEKLRTLGYPVGKSLWDYYGLESSEDLAELGEVLLSLKDGESQSAVMTAVFVMANADITRIRAEGYKYFHEVPITQGLPSPWRRQSLLGEYRRLIERGLFQPALHGYTHFNPQLLLRLAKESSERGVRVRTLLEHDIPYLASLTPEFNFALLDRSGTQERFLDVTEQALWIASGVKIYVEAFGHYPTSVCAPGYRCNETTYRLWQQAGVSVVHTAGGTFGLHHGLWQTPRNVPFEPAFDSMATDRALLAAEKAVACGEPIVIGTHSINYITHHARVAEKGRAELTRLLSNLRERYPNLRFSHDVPLYDSWRKGDRDWWRRPSKSELRNRFNHFFHGSSGTS